MLEAIADPCGIAAPAQLRPQPGIHVQAPRRKRITRNSLNLIEVLGIRRKELHALVRHILLVYVAESQRIHHLDEAKAALFQEHGFAKAVVPETTTDETHVVLREPGFESLVISRSSSRIAYLYPVYLGHREAEDLLVPRHEGVCDVETCRIKLLQVAIELHSTIAFESRSVS